MPVRPFRRPAVSLLWAEPVFVVLGMALLLVAFHQVTIPLEANSGFGYDGLFYARMVEQLRGADAGVILGPYAYRVLPALLVAWSGLEIRLGFYVLNVAATFAAGLVLLALLRHCGVPARARVQAITWWALLPFALRFAIHDPVLLDGIGSFLVVALVYTAMTRRLVLFALLLAAAALTRENLVVLAPLPLLRSLDSWRAASRAALAATLGPATLLAIHLWPLVAPDPSSESTLAFVGTHAAWILANYDDQATRLLLSPLLAFGALTAVVLARPLAFVRVFAREPGWSFVAVAMIVFAILGGLDHDRNLLALAPLMLVAVARVAPAIWSGGWFSALLTAAHVVSCRVLLMLGGDEATHFALMVQTMPIALLVMEAALIGALVVACALLIRARQSPEGAR